MGPRILAQAICDPGNFKVADRVNDQPFLVHVTGQLDGGDALPKRDYEIAAPSECDAAQTGLSRYIDEMVRLN